MKNSIQQIAEKFIINLQKYFSGDREIRIDMLENELLEKAKTVPLISVYEGIEKQGKRGKCREIFHISEYGKKPDASRL